MKIIIAPDKFKGSLTSFEVCDAIKTGFKEADNTIEIVSFPMADGGDGFAAVLQHYYKTATIHCNTRDPLGRNISVSWQWNKNDKTAIIEMAVASGLVLLSPHERNVLITSTFGTGLLIKDAIDKGAGKIILGIGGSATNDGGIGILAALGFQFIDQRNNPLSPVGKNLIDISKIIPPTFLPDIKIEIACDVQNVLYGPHGAAHIYAPQKGADEKAVRLLDDGLKNLAEIIRKQTGKDVAAIPGTGAAGGIAAGLMAFFDVTLMKGTDIVTAASGIENEIQNSACIITGEGKMDTQTLDGKVVSTIAGLAQTNKIPVIAFCGIQEDSDILKKQLDIIHIESLTSAVISKDQAMKNAGELLERKSATVFNEIIKPLMKA